MIEQLPTNLENILANGENTTVEFKEAKINYNFNDIGKYFYALSNEANLRDKSEAWLIFGINNCLLNLKNLMHLLY